MASRWIAKRVRGMGEPYAPEWRRSARFHSYILRRVRALCEHAGHTARSSGIFRGRVWKLVGAVRLRYR